MSARFENLTDPLPGFADRTGRDMQLRRYVDTQLAALFVLHGYEEVSVPILERASSFSEEVVGGSPWPEWDRRGVFYLHLPGYEHSYEDMPYQEPALLVPEGTISVSRWIAKAHSEGLMAYPRRVFYIMPCFRNELLSKLGPTKGRQFHQAGIEILGTNNLLADTDALLLAHQGLVTLGISPGAIVARVGNVAIFNSLCDESKLSGTDVLRAKDLLDTIAESRAGKDSQRLPPSLSALGDILSKYDLPDETRAKWDILCQAPVDELTPESSRLLPDAPVSELQTVCHLARSAGLNCLIDLAVVRSHEYYTGVVYELDIHVEHKPPIVEVAGGGRYNRLVGKFLRNNDDGMDVLIPSIGFAFGLERIASVLTEGALVQPRVQLNLNLSLDGSIADVVLVPDVVADASTLAKATAMRQSSQRVDLYCGDNHSSEAIARYAAQRGAFTVTVADTKDS